MLDTTPLPQNIAMDFGGAFKQMIDGKRVTKLEWADKRTYCLMKDDLFYIHKAGEKEDLLRPWIISYGDAIGLDWVTLPDDKPVLAN